MNMGTIIHVILASIFTFQMGSTQQCVNIFGQYVPQHFREKWITKLLRYFGSILNLSDFQLFQNAKWMEKVATKNKRLKNVIKILIIWTKISNFTRWFDDCNHDIFYLHHLAYKQHESNQLEWRMYCQPLNKREHISQRYRQRIHRTAYRTEPISRTIANSFRWAESAKILCCLLGCDTKRMCHQNQLDIKPNKIKNIFINFMRIA